MACLVYLNDVLVFSKSFDGHLKRLTNVIQCLQKAGLKLHPEKYHFPKSSIEYLGHVVSKDGLKPAEWNLIAVRNFPVPRDVAAARRFLGLAGYYRRYISGFFVMAAPLFRLLGCNSRFEWTVTCNEAFECLRSCLVSDPIVAVPDLSPEAKPFQLATNACDCGIGAVLSQGQNRVECVIIIIGYVSCTLRKPERNYSTIEKEALAIVWEVSYFRPYLYSNQFVLTTDHKPVVLIEVLQRT